jgi:hypothetical protein
MYERELLNDLPAYWKRNGRSGIDPMDGKPSRDYVSPAVREARTIEGNCKYCGNPLPVKSGRGRKPIMCKECHAKDGRRRVTAQRAKLASTRGTVGSVPLRSKLFANYVIYFNHGIPAKERLTWMDHDYSNAKAMTRPAVSSFTSEWYGVRDLMDSSPVYGNGNAKEDYFWRPVIDRKSVGQVRRGNDCYEFITESEALPKGAKPESAFQSHCEECGTQLKEVLARGRESGGKIGARSIACPKCGLVPKVTPCTSLESRGASRDWAGSA